MQAGPETVVVGPVEAVYWEGDAGLATRLAEVAAAEGRWPGLPALPPVPMRLIIARTADRFDSLTRGRLPRWSGAAAFPDRRIIILRIGPEIGSTLRHELAHLALRQWTRAAPLWFEEGYAARAAGEWGRLEALTMNWALLTGRAPRFPALNGALRGGPNDAQAAYGLATAAVLFLERLGGEAGLTPLLTSLRETRDFDRAVRRTHLLTLDQLEAAWHVDLQRRYGWLRVFTSLGLFWALTAGATGVVWWRRRKRDAVRRAALDVGWDVPAEEDLTA